MENKFIIVIVIALFIIALMQLMKVYDLASTTWLRTTPSSADQTAINAVNLDAVDIGKKGGCFYATNTEELLKQLDIIFINDIPDKMKKIQARLVIKKLGEPSLDSEKLIENFIQNLIPNIQA